MPHHVIYTKQAGRDTLANLNLTVEQFASEAEAIVARVFNDELGEDLFPGRTVKTDGIFESQSLPVDIELVILAWFTESRELYEVRLHAAISRALNNFFTSRGVAIESVPHTQAHLNIVG